MIFPCAAGSRGATNGAKRAVTKKKYSLIPEHAAQMDGWRDLWIARAMRTEPLTDGDRESMRAAVAGMYQAANLKPPAPERILFCPSPFVGSFASATYAYLLGKDPKAKLPHISEFSNGPMVPAGAERNKRWYRKGPAAKFARSIITGDFDINKAAMSMFSGGNMWAGWTAWVSFMRHVCKLGEAPYNVDYSKWHHYEEAAIHGGPRWMHADFCIISDFPELLQVDDDRRPHADRGPFCRWRDDTALYSYHGVRMPEWAMEAPESITVEDIKGEENVEVRRSMRTLYGEGRYLTDTKSVLIHADIGGARAKGAGPRALLKDDEGDQWLVGTDGSTGRTYYMKVPPHVKTCREAHEALCGFSEDKILNAS